jgi:hypothetical protein
MSGQGSELVRPGDLPADNPQDDSESATARLLLERAFQLAVFIVGDRAAALEAACRALARLKGAVSAQGRRLAYQPRGRSRGSAGTTRISRTRVVVGDLQLLQRLVYAETEPCERLLERVGPLDRQAMTLRFVKHLVRVALRRNSLHVALGVGRILYRYTTLEMQELYGVAVQDPDRVPDEPYCRSRRLQMMDELRDRFEGALVVVRAAKGEQRFEADEDSASLGALVEECLQRFTPWDSACHVPEGFDPFGEELPAFAYSHGHPDGEHAIEVNRIHALLHPPCFRRLVAALRLEPPAERLAVPRFRLSSGGGRPPHSSGGVDTSIDDDEWRWVVDRLRASGSPLGSIRRPGSSLMDRASRWLRTAGWRVHLRPALALSALALAVAMLTRWPSRDQSGPHPVSPPAAIPRPPADAAPPRTVTPSAPTPAPRPAVEEDVPRTLGLGPRARRLHELKTVEVEVPAGSLRAAQLREALAAVLAEHGLTPPASNRTADARLRASLSAAGGGARVRLTLRLVNVDGETLWSTPAGGFEGELRRDEDVRGLAERAAMALVKEAQRPSP